MKSSSTRSQHASIVLVRQVGRVVSPWYGRSQQGTIRLVNASKEKYMEIEKIYLIVVVSHCLHYYEC